MGCSELKSRGFWSKTHGHAPVLFKLSLQSFVRNYYINVEKSRLDFV